MSTFTEQFVVQDSGIVLQKIESIPIRLSSRFVGRLATSVTHSPVRPVAKGWLISMGTHGVLVYRRLRTMTIEAGITVAPDGVTLPTWISGGSAVKLKWRAPDTMTLVFGVWFSTSSTENKVVLPAFYSLDPQAYVIPIANVFEDGTVCNGTNRATTIDVPMIETANSELKAFMGSRYNADLMTGDRRLRSPEMFKWRAVEDGFEQVPVTGNWPQSCTQAGSGIIGMINLAACAGAREEAI